MTTYLRGTGRRLALAAGVALGLGLFSQQTAAAESKPLELRFAAGGEIGETSFGIFDLGLRKGALSLQLLTDTLDVRWAPEVTRGRYFLALRVEGFAAGLMISPWRAGAPDPGRAMYAAYAGAEGGYVRYLPKSFYAGVAGSARAYYFWGQEQTTVEVPGITPVFSVDGVLGRYTPTSHVWLRAGVDVQQTIVAPRASVEATFRPVGRLVPKLELRAGWAMNQTAVLLTRLGGMNPYVVPVAGAAWAEFWVERYAAMRVGPTLRLDLPRFGAHTLDLSVVTDVAIWDYGNAVGFAGQVLWRPGRFFVDLQVGYAPWLVRQEGLSRLSFFALVGSNWGAFKR